MKIIFLYFFSLVSFFSANSQIEGYKITYVNFNDTLEPGGLKFTNTVLTDGSKSASYKLPYEMKSPGMHTITTFDGKKKFEYYSEKDTLKVYVFKNFEENKLFFQSEYSFLMKESKTYIDSLYPFKWMFINEKRTSGNQMLKKATMRFRGRNYTAWYNESIPIANGPWKFGGLPGLIVEIYDDSFQVYWKLTKFEKSVEKLPEFPSFINESFADFKKLYKENFFKVKKSIESINAQDNPDCKNCATTTKTVTDSSVELLTIEGF
ncbi:MAG: GLPGLI family protein [Chitinophagaceae bacterium]|nr:GLPGLI family protein [Chitinophagaceae bacterium]